MGLTARKTGPTFTKSELPPGGSPALDSAYETWVTNFIRIQNDHWNDAFLFGFPPEELLNRFVLENYLYETLGPGLLFEEFHLTYHHRQRWFAIELHERQKAFIRAAETFVAIRKERRKEEEIGSK